MGVCDVPVIHEVCNAAGDAAGAVVTAPFDWLAQGMGGAAEWMFTSVWKVIDTTTYVDVTSGEYTKVYNIMFGVGVFVMLGFFMLQVIGGMIRREPAALSRAALGLAKSILGSFVALALLATALEITDQLCIGIVNAAGTNMNEMGDKVAVLAAGLGAINLAAPGAGAILTIFLASLAIIGAMVVWISLLIRKALLLIAIVFAPIALAGSSWDHTRSLAEPLGDVRDRDDPVEGRPRRDLPARDRPGLRADRRGPGVGQPADGRRRPDADGRVRAVPDLQGDRLHGLRHVPRDVGRAGGQGVAQPADADPALAAHRQRAGQGPGRQRRRRWRWRYDVRQLARDCGAVRWRTIERRGRRWRRGRWRLGRCSGSRRSGCRRSGGREGGGCGWPAARRLRRRAGDRTGRGARVRRALGRPAAGRGLDAGRHRWDRSDRP